MNVNALNNAYRTNEVPASSNISVNKNGKLSKALTGEGQEEKLSFNQSENLITSKEREFFIKMFPENQAQLQNHVLFNRNGRLQNAAINKGTIIDGRV
jgi:hypothetical protein